MTKKKIFICLATGILALGLSTANEVVNADFQKGSSQTEVSNASAKLSKLKFIGNGYSSNLGLGEITSDGKGNLTTTRFLDDRAVYLQPVYEISNLSDRAKLTARVTVKTASETKVSSIALTQNAHEDNFYDQKSSTALANPGKNRTKVTYEIRNGNEVVGTFVINFAPVTEAPAEYQPIVAPEEKLAEPANVQVKASKLSWGAVAGAEQYKIVVYRAGESKAVASALSDATQESLADIKAFLGLPAGEYQFAIKASKLHQGFWNASLESNLSTKVNAVLVD